MKKPLIIVAVAIVLLFTAWFITLSFLVNKQAIKSELTESFKTITGLELEVQGNVAVSIFPAPHVNIDSIYVRNVAGSQTPFLLTVKNIDIKPVFASLFGHKLAISNVEVSGVNLFLERLEDEKLNWQELTASAPSNAAHTQGHAFDNTYINATNAQVNYKNPKTNTTFVLSNFNAAIVTQTSGSTSSNNVRISLNYMKTPFVIEAKSTGNLADAISSGVINTNIVITSGKNNVGYTGALGTKNNSYFANGDMSLAVEDAASWVRLFCGNNYNIDAPDYKKLPLTAKSKITFENGKDIMLPDLQIDGDTIKASAQVDMSIPSKIDIKADVKTLNFDNILTNIAVVNSKYGSAATPAETAKNEPASTEKSFFSTLDVSGNIKIEDALYNSKTIKNTNIEFDMQDGEMTIPQAITNLPGDSRLVFTGIGRQGFDGFMLEGQVDAEGNNFTQMINIFKSTGFTLPEADFKRFHMRSNAVLSARELRFTELNARIENIGIAGAIILKLNDINSLQAAVNVSGLNLDNLITAWGIETWQKAFLSNNSIEKTRGSMSLWLKNLGYNMLVSTSLNNYTLNGKVRDRADFKLLAATNKIQVSDLKTNYNGSNINSTVTIDVSAETPVVNLQSDIDRFDTEAFFNLPTVAPVKTSRWSRDTFDFNWFELVNATYHLKFGHFKYKLFEADNVDLTGNLTDRKMNVENFKLTTLGASASGKMAINGGTIPAANIAVDVLSLKTESLAVFFPILKNVTGTYNINSVIATNGINFESWVANLNGNIGVGGRDVEVRGFNLAGIVRAVSYVRTVADILNVVKRAFPNGNTVFSSMMGEWGIDKGVLKASRAKIINEQSDAGVAGEVDLLNWKTHSMITFALKTLDAANPPSMTINLIGDLDNPDIEFDTRSLEQYVANKTSEKMFQGYGTH